MAQLTKQDLEGHLTQQIQNMDAAYQQAGYTRVGNQYVLPNYSSQLQAQQLTGTEPANPAKAAGDAAATVIGQFKAQNALPLKPQDLTNIIDTSGNPAPLGTTQEEINSGKYHGLTTKERDDRDLLLQANNLYKQIENASNKVNTGGGLTILGQSLNQLYHANGLLNKGDTNARYLKNQVKGQVNAFTEGALSIGRFSPEEIGNFVKNVPSPYDSQEQAQAKLAQLKGLIDSKKQALGITGPLGGVTPAPGATGGWSIVGKQ